MSAKRGELKSPRTHSRLQLAERAAVGIARTIMTTITCVAVWLLLPLIVLLGVALWLSESRQQRIKRLYCTGYSQARIAQHLNISRYAVRKALAT